MFQSPISGSQTSGASGGGFKPSVFQSPISGSQTKAKQTGEKQLLKFQSPISGSQTWGSSRRRRKIILFQSPISGSQTMVLPNRCPLSRRVSIPYKRVTNPSATPPCFSVLWVSIPYKRVTNAEFAYVRALSRCGFNPL